MFQAARRPRIPRDYITGALMIPSAGKRGSLALGDSLPGIVAVLRCRGSCAIAAGEPELPHPGGHEVLDDIALTVLLVALLLRDLRAIDLIVGVQRAADAEGRDEQRNSNGLGHGCLHDTH